MDLMAQARLGWLVTAGLTVIVCQGGAADAATLALGEATAAPGQAQVGLPLSLQVGSSEQVSAVVVDVRFDPALASFSSVELDAPITALGKQVGTSLLGPGHVRLMLYGLDRQTLSSGTLGRCLLGVPASAPAGSAALDLQQGLSVNADGQETPLALTAGRIWIEGVPTSSPAAVQFLTPAANSTITGASVSFSFSVLNAVISSTATHIRLSIDGGTPRTLDSVLPYVWTGVDPGTHTAVAQLVSATGQLLTNPEATTSVAFTAAEEIVSPVSLTVLTPQPGTSQTSTTIKIQVDVKGIAVKTGTGKAHLHYKIDGGGVSHVYNTFPFYYINLKPGTHTLGIMLADNTTHTRIPGTLYHSIVFTVAP